MFFCFIFGANLKKFQIFAKILLTFLKTCDTISYCHYNRIISPKIGSSAKNVKLLGFQR